MSSTCSLLRTQGTCSLVPLHPIGALQQRQRSRTAALLDAPVANSVEGQRRSGRAATVRLSTRYRDVLWYKPRIQFRSYICKK